MKQTNLFHCELQHRGSPRRARSALTTACVSRTVRASQNVKADPLASLTGARAASQPETGEHLSSTPLSRRRQRRQRFSLVFGPLSLSRTDTPIINIRVRALQTVGHTDPPALAAALRANGRPVLPRVAVLGSLERAGADLAEYAVRTDIRANS